MHTYIHTYTYIYIPVLPHFDDAFLCAYAYDDHDAEAGHLFQYNDYHFSNDDDDDDDDDESMVIVLVLVRSLALVHRHG